MTTAERTETERSADMRDASTPPQGPSTLSLALRAPVDLLRFAALRYWPILIILVLWPLWIAVNNYSRTVVPGPSNVLSDVVFNPMAYLGPVFWTLVFTAVGFTVGMLLGIVLGALVWMSPLASGLIMPAALVVRVVPMTALVPILARLLGYGDLTVLLIVVLLVFFPAFSLTVSGMSQAADTSVDLFTVLGSGKIKRMFRLHLPTAIPSIMLAARISAPLTVLAVLLSDYLLNGRGVGALMRHSSDFMLIEREWGAALIATAISVVCFGLARSAERKVNDRVT